MNPSRFLEVDIPSPQNNITTSHVLHAWGPFLESRGNLGPKTNIEIKN